MKEFPLQEREAAEAARDALESKPVKMTKSDLLACPLCCGEPFYNDELIDGDTYQGVMCGNCGCSIHVIEGETEFEAAKRWNTRKGIEHDDLLRTVDALHGAESSLEQAIDARDAAEEAISQAYYLVTGRSPEWSNLFGHKEALEEIDDAQTTFREVSSRAQELEIHNRNALAEERSLHIVIANLSDALRSVLPILEATKYSTGLGKNQLERIANAKSVLGSLGT